MLAPMLILLALLICLSAAGPCCPQALHQAIQTALAAVEQHQGEGLPWWWPEEGVVLATAEPAAAGMPYGGGALGASALAPATLAGLHRQVQPPQRPRQRHPAPERPAGAVAARQLEAAKAAAAALLADAHQEAAALADGPQAEGRLRHQQQVLSHDAFCRDVRRALERCGVCGGTAVVVLLLALLGRPSMRARCEQSVHTASSLSACVGLFAC